MRYTAVKLSELQVRHCNLAAARERIAACIPRGAAATNSVYTPSCMQWWGRQCVAEVPKVVIFSASVLCFHDKAQQRCMLHADTESHRSMLCPASTCALPALPALQHTPARVGCRYASRITLQTGRTEMIAGMKQSTFELLLEFRKRNK